MKKLTTLTAIGLSALMLLSSCAQKSDTTSKSRTEDTSVSSTKDTENTDTESTQDFSMLNDFRNEPVRITDKDGKELGMIYATNSLMLTEKGVLYTAWPEGADNNSRLEYHLFDQNTGEDKKLGEVTDPAYEDTQSRVEIDGKVYSLAMFGDITDNEPDPLYLQEIDLINGSISLCPIIQNGYPYQSMCRVGNKLLLFVHDQQPEGILYDRVFEFDPETKTSTERLTFQYSEKEQSKEGDTIRSLYCDGKAIYILRVHAQNNRSQLFVDIYDMEYKITEEKDITTIFSQGLNAYDPIAYPELDMFYQVARFFVTEDGKLYYLNFCDLSFLADINTGDLVKAGDPLFRASFGSGSPFFATIFKGGPDESNHIFSLENGELVDSTLDIFDAEYYIESTEVSNQGIRVVCFTTQDAGQANTDHPDIYCILK